MADLDEALQEIDEVGYTILEDVIEPDLIDALNDDLDRLERRPRRGAGRPTPSRARRRSASTTCWPTARTSPASRSTRRSSRSSRASSIPGC